ncbi:hypothetical protein [Bradyrhizobium sp. sGM-13]|uniref:hypothetical protein n=1 Tax=Bradyrhizobium sp. sGM-13 TaxID=2831781 RepID=UPI001BCB1007|nr:hypothetical protein [Bradyrhizobium sp. sGM-13]
MSARFASHAAASEYLVAQRNAVEGYHRRDADLLVVGAMIAGIAALRQQVRFRLEMDPHSDHALSWKGLLRLIDGADDDDEDETQDRRVRIPMIARSYSNLMPRSVPI